jgi:hypothetical protein
MNKRKRTEKSKYKHETTGDYCTCAAYVAEIMCIRNAEYKNEGSLPYKFWNKKPWDWTFKRQLIVARNLLKKYDEKVLVKAINAPECKRVFSLNNQKLKNTIKKYQRVFEKESKNQENLEVKQDAQHRKKTYGKISKLNKLRSIDTDAKKNKS